VIRTLEGAAVDEHAVLGVEPELVAGTGHAFVTAAVNELGRRHRVSLAGALRWR